MGTLKAAGDLDCGALDPTNVIVNGNGWFDPYDNGAATTLPLVLAADNKQRRNSTRKCIVTLGASTNVTCAAAAQLIGFGAGKAAGDYLLTLEAGAPGIIGKFEALD